MGRRCRYRDLRGRRFGRLNVLHRDFDTSPKDRGRVKWRVRCDCGSPPYSVNATHLLTGASRSCGCLKRELTSLRSVVDLTGGRFGRLTVLSRAGSTKWGSSAWRVKCDCGSEFRISAHHLSGGTKSCGCLQREKAARTVRPQGKAQHGFLYLIRLYDDTERFLKVGFTESVADRVAYYSRRCHYRVRIIHTVRGPKNLMLRYEKALHDGSGATKHRPKRKFKGYTECFKETALLDLCEYLDEIETGR